MEALTPAPKAIFKELPLTTAFRMAVAASIAIAPVQALSAQSTPPRIAPAASVLFRPTVVPDAAHLAPAHVGGHGETGAIVGGAVLGLGGALLGNGLCQSNEKCTGATLGGAAVGAVVGAVLGAFIGARID